MSRDWPGAITSEGWPSISGGDASPCQWTLVGSERRFSIRAEKPAPRPMRMVGPGKEPPSVHTAVVAPDQIDWLPTEATSVPPPISGGRVTVLARSGAEASGAVVEAADHPQAASAAASATSNEPRPRRP